MVPLYRYDGDFSFWERQHKQAQEAEAERIQRHLLTTRLSHYTFPVQELIQHIHHAYGLHAALLATDALERQLYSKLH